MAFTVGDVYIESRALLNDYTGTKYNDGVLVPIAKLVYDELSRKINKHPIEYNKNVTTLTAFSATAITVSNIADLIKPIELSERAGSGSGLYSLMQKVAWLPEVAPGTTYGVWAWLNQEIKLLGLSSGSRDLKIKYIRSLPAVDWNLSSTSIPINDIKSWLTNKIASVAVLAVEKNLDLSKAHRALADEIFMDIADINRQGESEEPSSPV